MNLKGKLSKREVLLLTGSISLSLIYLTRSSIIRPLERKQLDLKEELAVLTVEAGKYERMIAQAEINKQILEAERKKWLGTDIGDGPAAVQVQEFARRSGLKLVSMHPGETVRQGGHEQQTLRLVIDGDFKAVIGFINLMLRSPVFNIKEIKIGKDANGNGRNVKALLTVEKFVLL